ncbi:MAG: hypothetical protein ABW328_03390 [Ilumatobacteraceae bacterium]
MAFCEDFEGARNTVGNRNGDLSVADFSVSRWSSALSSSPGHVERAAIPSCRAGVSATPLPPGDVLTCDPSTSIGSHYGLIATAEQNYGDTSARINQPFDIAGRTGTIRFDTNLSLAVGVLGWQTLIFTPEPSSAPSYLADNSGGATPERGLALHFNWQCVTNGQFNPSVQVRTYDRHRETLLTDDGGSCTAPISVASGRLNRVEVRLSTSHIEVWISDASSDGVRFGALKRVFSSPLSLGFTRGNLYVGVHNHATVKYAGLASWTTLWDNVAFDGPALPAQRVSQVADAAVPSGSGVDNAYALGNGIPTTALELPGVSTSGATSGHLVFDLMADTISNANFADWRVRYRLNGGAWHDIALSPDQVATASGRGGAFGFTAPVSLAELRSGTNSLELSGTGFFLGYQPYVGNIDLVLE